MKTKQPRVDFGAVKLYENIPTTVGLNNPGVYCGECGQTFSLYPWSMRQPDYVDKNGKPWYDGCGFCREVI